MSISKTTAVALLTVAFLARSESAWGISAQPQTPAQDSSVGSSSGSNAALLTSQEDSAIPPGCSGTHTRSECEAFPTLTTTFPDQLVQAINNPGAPTQPVQLIYGDCLPDDPSTFDKVTLDILDYTCEVSTSDGLYQKSHVRTRTTIGAIADVETVTFGESPILSIANNEFELYPFTKFESRTHTTIDFEETLNGAALSSNTYNYRIDDSRRVGGSENNIVYTSAVSESSKGQKSMLGGNKEWDENILTLNEVKTDLNGVMKSYDGSQEVTNEVTDAEGAKIRVKSLEQISESAGQGIYSYVRWDQGHAMADESFRYKTQVGANSGASNDAAPAASRPPAAGTSGPAAEPVTEPAAEPSAPTVGSSEGTATQSQQEGSSTEAPSQASEQQSESFDQRAESYDQSIDSSGQLTESFEQPAQVYEQPADSTEPTINLGVTEVFGNSSLVEE